MARELASMAPVIQSGIAVHKDHVLDQYGLGDRGKSSYRAPVRTSEQHRRPGQRSQHPTDFLGPRARSNRTLNQHGYVTPAGQPVGQPTDHPKRYGVIASSQSPPGIISTCTNNSLALSAQGSVGLVPQARSGRAIALTVSSAEHLRSAAVSDATSGVKTVAQDVNPLNDHDGPRDPSRSELVIGPVTRGDGYESAEQLVTNELAYQLYAGILDQWRPEILAFVESARSVHR